MDNEEMMEKNEIVLDEEKTIRMIKKIALLEKNNSRTNALSEKEIKEEIKKIIEGEVEKCY